MKIYSLGKYLTKRAFAVTIYLNWSTLRTERHVDEKIFSRRLTRFLNCCAEKNMTVHSIILVENNIFIIF